MSQKSHRRRNGMNPDERRAASALAAIYALRMLGLFMILPVFALYADELDGYEPVLVGVAIGAYGLTQALLQIPFGMLSDRVGRKPVITAGLLIFAIGSVVAGLSDSIQGVILGRALQGAGAIAAAIMALTADLTREEQRTKAMAMIGMSIGLSFAVSLVAGPILANWYGLKGIFWLTAILALLGIVLLHLRVPTPAHSHFHRDTEAEPARLSEVLRDPQLLRLDVGILILHLIMTATFVVLPLVLRDQAGLASDDHWLLYVAVLGASVLLMVPFIIIAERRHLLKEVFSLAVLGVLAAQLGLAQYPDAFTAVALFLLLYFTAFNLLEASLPSLVSRMAPAQHKGSAMGAYSTSQFLGAFLGGVLGGWVYQQYGAGAVFLMNAAGAGIWLLLAISMRAPRYLSNHTIRVGEVQDVDAVELTRRLNQVSGVAEAVIVAEDGLAYLKVDRKRLDEDALEALSAKA